MRRSARPTLPRQLARAARRLWGSPRLGSMGGPILPPPARLDMAAIDDITDDGERVIPDLDDYNYHAHLSIYLFARPYGHGRHVLDAGCGTGYGSQYLISHGARSVLGIDISTKAIDYARSRFVHDALRYEVMDLRSVSIPRRSGFGLVFCSNVLEHVLDADAFVARAALLMARDGVFVLSVPTIDSPDALRENYENPYHVNNLTPAAWLAKMRRFFLHAQGYRHWLEPEWVTATDEQDYSRKASAKNFTFTERDDAEMMSGMRTLGTVIVARDPRPVPLPKSAVESSYPPEWNVEIDPATGRPGRIGPPVGTLGPIHGERTIEQEIRSPADGLRSIRIMMATYARANDSVLTVALREGSPEGRVLASRDVPAGEIADGGWLELRVEPRAGSRDRGYVLTLASPGGRPDNAVTAYYRSDGADGAGTLRVGGTARPGNVLWYELIS